MIIITVKIAITIKIVKPIIIMNMKEEKITVFKRTATTTKTIKKYKYDDGIYK